MFQNRILSDPEIGPPSMSLSHFISYPLFLIAALEAALGVILLRHGAQRGPVRKAVIALAFFSAAFSLNTALMYFRTTNGLSIDLFARMNWIGWFTVPAALQVVFFLKDESSRIGRLIGLVLYPVWTVILGVCVFTDLIVATGYSVIPFINAHGQLEHPARLFGTLLAAWLVYENLKLKKDLTGIRRAQLNFFFFGIIMFGTGAAFTAGVLQMFGGFGFEPGLASYFSLPWVALSYYAMTRQRLFDVRFLLSRALSVGILITILFIVQVAVFRGIKPLVGETPALLVSLLILGIIFFSTRLNRHLQRWAQRLVLQDRYEYQSALQESIKAINTILDLQALKDYIVTSIRQNMGVENTCLVLLRNSVRTPLQDDCPVDGGTLAWLQREGRVVVREEVERSAIDGDLRQAVGHLKTAGIDIVVPLHHKGIVRGFIMLGPKQSGQPYIASDVDLLELLASHAAIAIENAHLFEEARRITESFHESEEKFHTLANTAAMAIFIHQGGNFLYANRAAELIGGYSIAEYLTMNFMSLVHPDYIDQVKTRARERLGGSGAVPVQYEFKLVRKDKQERWVLMTAGISEFEGKPAVIGTLIDITARKQAEDDRTRLHEENERQYRERITQQERFSAILSRTQDGFWINHQNERFEYVNDAYCRMTGYSREEVMRMQISDFEANEDRDVVKQHTERIMQQGYDLFETRHRRKDGSLIDFEVSVNYYPAEQLLFTFFRDITARKMAEKERYQLSLLVESSTDFIGMSTPEGAITFVNSAGRKMLGLSADYDVKQLTIKDLFQKEDWPLLLERILPTDAWRGEISLRHWQTGVPIPTDTYGFAVFDQKTGAIMARAAVIRDITDLKRAREERERYFQELQQTMRSLQESEARFRSLAETAPATIFIHQGGNFLYANPASEAMIGYSREEFLKMDFWGVTHPEDKDMIVQRARSRLKGDVAPQRYEFRIIKKDGSVIWVDMAAGVIEYEGKSAVIGTCFDITKRKKAEKEQERLNQELQKALASLKESEARFRTLAETTTAGIFIHRGKNFIYANPAIKKITGYSGEEFLALDFWTMVHPDYRDLVRQRGAARLEGSQQVPPEYEIKIIIKSGEVRWGNLSAAVIDYEGAPAVIVTFFDVTDRKHAEEETVKLYEKQIAEEKRHLVEKEKILMDLHDGIGGITTNISILSELAQKAEDIDKIKKTLSTISRLSREGISEIRSFMHSLDSRELNWRTLAAELRSQGINMVEPHGIDFSADTSVGEIDEQPGSLLWVNLFKIYKESLTNVIKHSGAHSVVVTLKVDAHGIDLSIQDDGKGWKENPNSGRGLSNMKKRAEEVGGRVSVSSLAGTRIWLTIPIPLKYPITGIDL